MPAFLLLSLPNNLSAQTTFEPVAVLFEVKLAGYSIFNDYSWQDLSRVFPEAFASPLNQIYKATVPVWEFDSLSKDKRLKFFETDYKVSAAAVAPDDQFFTIDATLDSKQWYLPKIQMPQAWDYAKGNTNVVVAIIDTGIHSAHVELNDGRVMDGYDAVTGAIIPANTNSDNNGHGTAVAGIIGAATNNQRGIAGINWQIRLMPVKALNADGTGLISTVSSGIVWAADHGANVINLSLGGQGFGNDQVLNSAISYAYNRGVVIVAAAGNDLAENGTNLNQTPVYPVCADNGDNMVIGVAATDINDRKANFSNYGSLCIDISAPGKKILTTAYLPHEPSNNVLIYASGTSLATPIVSGVAALMKALNPNLTNKEVRNILLTTSDNIDALNLDNCGSSSCAGLIGKGRINALKALTPQPVANNSLVREKLTGKIYLVSGGGKRLVTDFVFGQRQYDSNSVINEQGTELSNYVLGLPLPPLEGTLLKGVSDSTVYVINQELLRPLTFLVFVSRNYDFASVNVISDSEIANFSLGDWYWPPDGTMVLVTGDPTVYVMDSQVRRAVTYFVFTQRKLSFAKVIKVSLDEFSHVPKPVDNFWLAPIDGTLVKSLSDSTVYIIEAGKRRALSYETFVSRNYKFSSVKKLPQPELDVMALGEPL